MFRELRHLAGAILGVSVSVALSSCGDQGAPTPDNARGTWGTDCNAPFIRIEETKVHVFPDDADYTVTSAKLDRNHLVLTYGTPHGAATETYVLSQNALQLVNGHYADADVVWHKQPMKKC